MARWVLRELLPAEADRLRVDWHVVAGNGNGAGPLSLFSVAAHEDVVAEYEGLVRELGWEPGRVVPWTLAAAAALEQDAERTLLLCEGDGALASAYEDDGVIQFHRAWRARVPVESLTGEIASLQRYVADHLEATVAGVVVCGPESWQPGAVAACASAGLQARSLTPEQALLGAVRG